MKKNNVKKLTLSRETLRGLTREQAKAVWGGGDSILICPPPPTSDSVRACCAQD
jgi:hypothetical protein